MTEARKPIYHMKSIRFFGLLLVVMWLLFPLTASGVDIGELTYTLNSTKKTATVTGAVEGNTFSGNLVIPASVEYEGETYTVTTFQARTGAFNNYTQLTSVTIPESITSLGTKTFSSCTNLTTVIIHASIPGITASVFSGCTALTTVNIPETVTTIGASAFNGCSSLESIDIPENVTSILTSAFSGCSSLKSIIIPEGVTSIGNNAFSGCTSLTSINIPEAVIDIGSGAFSNCTELTSINIPQKLTSIDSGTFFGCTGLKSINIPESVTSILTSAFNGCSGLRSIDIPKSVTYIGDNAFKDCSGLTSITIPEAVTSIGQYTFDGCSALDEITVLAITPPVVTSDNSFSNYDVTLKIYSISAEAYKNADVWHNFSNINEIEAFTYEFDPSSKTAILTGTVIGNSLTEKLVIPSSVIFEGETYTITAIGDNAFAGYSGIPSVTIPESITTIGGSAFSGCTGLTAINIPENVEFIGSGAFEGCNGIKKITLQAVTPPAVADINCFPDYEMPLIVPIESIKDYRNANVWNSFDAITVDDILTYSFTYSLARVTGTTVDNTFEGDIVIPSSVVSEGVTYRVYCIDTNAFEGYSKIESVRIPESVSYIYEKAFYNCSSLKSINIPQSVSTISNSAFSGCASLTSITLPESLTSISNSTFSGCASLTSINIPENVTSIGSSAFEDCSSLTSVNIPEKVVTINAYTFSGCSALRSIVIPESVTAIGSRAFFGCYALDEITVRSTTPPTINTNWQPQLCFYNYDAKLIVPEESLDDYKTADIWSQFFIGAFTYTFDTESKTATVTGARIGSLLRGDIVIPTSVDYEGETYTVTGIGKDAFKLYSNITSVTIPESVTTIGNTAFWGCDSLNEIIVLGSVPPTVMAPTAFQNYEVTLSVPEESLEEYKQADVWRQFYIGNLTYDFDEDTQTATVTGAAVGDTYTGELIIPETVYYNGVTYSVTSIGNAAFDTYKKLTSVQIPESVTFIDEYAFSLCFALTSINIPSKITSIEAYTFWGCDFSTIDIPESVNTIGDFAFNCCASLQSLTIPGKVTQLGGQVLYECSNLTELTVKAITPPTLDTNYYDIVSDYDIPLYVPSQSVELYKAAPTWKNFKNIYGFDILADGIMIIAEGDIMEIELPVGQSLRLDANVFPEETTDKTVTWDSSDHDIATFTEEHHQQAPGLRKAPAIAPGVTITAKAKGSATISASTVNGKTAEFKVTAIEYNMSGIESVSTDASSEVKVVDGNIIAPDGAHVEVYNIAGHRVGSTNLPAGVYIVMVNGVSHKVTIR